MTRADADRSFERLYVQHRRDVFGAALRDLGNVHDAEDVTQAAFIDAYRAILRGSSPESPRAWLLAIGENVRRRRFRTALRRPREEPLDAEVGTTDGVGNEQAQALRAALEALPPQQRDVVVLREIAGLSYEEIAERVGSGVPAVQMLLFRARKTLRARLEPPVVAAPRRSLVPLWLAQFLGRGDAVSLTPRGAGAVGAAVLAVGGATVGIVESQQPSPSRADVPAAASPAFLTPVPRRAALPTVVAEAGRTPAATAATRSQKRDKARPTARRDIPPVAHSRPGQTGSETGTAAPAAGAASPDAAPASSDVGPGEPVLPSAPPTASLPAVKPPVPEAVPPVAVAAGPPPLPAPTPPVSAPVPPVSVPAPPVGAPAPPVSVPAPPPQPPTPPAVPPPPPVPTPPVSGVPPVPAPPVPEPPVSQPVPPVPVPLP